MRTGSVGGAGGFALNQGPHALLLSPTFGNSSRESLESTGSSYHSSGDKDKKDGTGLLGALGPLEPQWHDLESTSPSASASTSTSSNLGFGLGLGISTSTATKNELLNADKAEEYVQRHAGLTRNDFVAVQARLVGFANKSEVVRERRDSLKRRRRSLSTSQQAQAKGGAVKVRLFPCLVTSPGRPHPAMDRGRRGCESASCSFCPLGLCQSVVPGSLSFRRIYS